MVVLSLFWIVVIFDVFCLLVGMFVVMVVVGVLEGMFV